MYSSVYGGVVTDPALMMIPMDDHMVHRADGVFEAFKCVEGRIYNLRAHLDRLARSARAVGLRIPVSRRRLVELTIETVRIGRRRNCMIRLFVSRGTGSFGVNPCDCPKPHIYIVVTALGVPFMRRHPRGATACSSAVPPREPFCATIKSCNYLLNALMAREARRAGADFAVGIDERGFLTEGATENVAIVTARGELRFPRADRTVTGTTMVRVIALARPLLKSGDLSAVRTGDITRRDVFRARELLIMGTTHDLVAVVRFDGRKIGRGRPGAVYRKLQGLLRRDIRRNRGILTPVFQ
jgi:branched-chain amino acid aminotransferase